jgi:opacity protein-like surface antigen
MRSFLVFILFVAVSTPAAAQSTYVGASLVGDVARVNKIEFDDDFARLIGTDVAEDGEALGFNVKVGREIGERWGVELEFARTGEFETRGVAAIPAIFPERLDLRVPPLEFESERTHTMIGALAFVRQELGDRVELSFLGGISFNRIETEHEYTGPRILIFPPVPVPNYEQTTYGVGPTIGVESAFEFGAAAVTTGVRLQTLGNGGSGWLIRPNVGMRWTF